MKIAKLIMLVFIFVSGVANAENEVDGWYLSKGGDYLVRDSIKGNIHAKIGVAKSGKVYVYFNMFDSDCKGDSGDIISHNPLYINDTLTRYSQYCDKEERYFLPATEAGHNHLISEFKLKSFVEVRLHDGSGKLLFSAKGFTDAFNKVTVKNSGI